MRSKHKSSAKTALIVPMIFLSFVISCFSDKYGYEDARRNYYDNREELDSLVSYFRSICPPDNGFLSRDGYNRGVSIGPGQTSGHYDIGLYIKNGTVQEHSNIGGSDLELKSREMQNILISLGWTDEIAVNLIERLEKVNCYNISSMDGFVLVANKETDWVGFSYAFYESPLPDSTINIIKRDFEAGYINDSTFVNRAGCL